MNNQPHRIITYKYPQLQFLFALISFNKLEHYPSQCTTRQAMYIQHNNEARSCNHCCSGKALQKYYRSWVCVCSLMYVACYAHVPYCHLWSVRLYNNFPYYLIRFGQQIRNTWKVLKCGAGEGWRRSVGPIMW